MVKDFYDTLFKKEEKTTDFNAFFERLNVDQFFNSLSMFYHPSKLIAKLGGVRNFHLLKKDEDIFAALDKRSAALLDTKLTLDGPDEQIKKIFEDELKPHERQLKQDFFDTQFNGYGVEQIIYNEDGSGKIDGFQKEDFWRFRPMPDLIHVILEITSNDEYRNKIMPWGKWVLTTNNGTYSNPAGDPMAEKLINPWIFKCNGWDIWLDFAKRFANGFMHGKIEDESKKKEFRESLEKAGKSAIIVTDKNTDLNLVQPNRDSNIYSMIIDKTISSINKVILGETLTSNVGASGSYAAASVHNDVRLEKTMADIALVESAIDQIIEQACFVKGIDYSKAPKAKLIFDPSLNTELATRDASLKSAGVNFTKKYFKNKYGFEDDEFDLAPANPYGSLFNQKTTGKSFLRPEDVKTYLGYNPPCGHGKLNLSEDANLNRKINRSYEEKEELVQLLNRVAAPPISTEDIFAAINVSKNSKELDENLARLFDQRNNDFSEVMTMALYNAAAKGAQQGNPSYIKKEDQE